MLIANNLKKVYTLREKKKWYSPGTLKDVEAVKGLSIKIEPGQIVGLLGINGAGKTTTIKMLSTMLEPTAGTLQVDGIDGIKDPQKVRKIVNVISGGERNIYWRLTARENLEYFGSLYNLNKKQLEDYCESSLRLVGLEDSTTPVERFSKGMKQRLQIARGLINNPKYLFLDEPTLGLDIAIAKDLRGYIRNLATEYNKGILLTTHYISEVEELCDWVYVIDKGNLVIEGTPKDIIKAVKPEIKIVLLVPYLNENLKKQLNSLNEQNCNVEFEDKANIIEISVISKENMTSQLIKLLMNYEVPILNLTVKEANLESALLKLASEEEVSPNVLVTSH
ncbi:ABC transporter ATP-binding protein [Bacillus cereus]|nr:ABC transporter ATP-binding protein [Bacillus cereus]